MKSEVAEMSESMIERIAKVLHEADGYDTWPEPECTQCVDLVRTVLAELREPTDEMVWAGAEAMPSVVTDARPVWMAMIDAALSEKAEP